MWINYSTEELRRHDGAVVTSWWRWLILLSPKTGFLDIRARQKSSKVNKLSLLILALPWFYHQSSCTFDKINFACPTTFQSFEVQNLMFHCSDRNDLILPLKNTISFSVFIIFIAKFYHAETAVKHVQDGKEILIIIYDRRAKIAANFCHVKKRSRIYFDEGPMTPTYLMTYLRTAPHHST